MLISRKATASVALAAGLAVSLAACGSSSSGANKGGASGASSGSTGSTSGGANSALAIGAASDDAKSGSNGTHGSTPKRGGTLKFLGAGDVDHLDPAASYYTVGYTVLRMDSRQLVTYPNSVDPKVANVPVPDMAESVPTPTNGGKTYTFKIKQGVQWNIPGGAARQVTSKDMARGIQRICNPVQPSGASTYYTSTITGMAEFCTKFAKVKGTAAAISAFMDANPIAGLKTPDDSTIEFDLKAPAGDFMNILALPFASAAPVETNKYVPDSAQYNQNFISDGAYTITKYVPAQSIQLTRNPAWKSATDKVRHAYVDNVSIKEGSDEGPVQQQLQTGDIDMEFDTTVPTASLPALKAKNDPHLSIQDVGSTTYTVFNELSPSNGGALQKVAVRQALEHCVSKTEVGQVLGGATLYTPIDQILTPPITGYKQIDPYNNLNGQEDAATGKKMLAAAGYPNGLNLSFLVRNKGKAPKIAVVMQADMAKCGVKLNVKLVAPSDFYVKHLSNPSATKTGDWDISVPGWNPDWQGNAARSFFAPLLDPRTFTEGTTNYGDYGAAPAEKDVTTKIDDALAATDLGQVADKWAALDAETMKNAPWIPLVTGKTPYYFGKHVQNWVFFNFSNNGDPTNVWLDNG